MRVTVLLDRRCPDKDVERREHQITIIQTARRTYHSYLKEISICKLIKLLKVDKKMLRHNSWYQITIQQKAARIYSRSLASTIDQSHAEGVAAPIR